MVFQSLGVTRPSLPAGGGAIKGFGETFRAAEFTGTAALALPIQTSPCRGAEPELSLDYGSTAGNGPFGLGWSVALPSIVRKTSRGTPRYDDTDVFQLAGVDDLVPVVGSGRQVVEGHAEYTVTGFRPRVEGSSAKIERWDDIASGTTSWRIVSTDNTLAIYGLTSAETVADPHDPTRVFRWLLSETETAHGDRTRYAYRPDGAERHIERISYGNAPDVALGETWHFAVEFDYAHGDEGFARPDAFSDFRAGFEIRTTALCREIRMLHRFPAEFGSADPVCVHTTRLVHDTTSTTSFGPALLVSVESIGWQRTDGALTSQAVPPLEFRYTRFDPSDAAFVPVASLDGTAITGVEASTGQLVDLYGDGLPGVLYADGISLRYRAPAGPDVDGRIGFAPADEPLTFPLHRDVGGRTDQLVDVDGDGRLNLVVAGASVSGFYELNADRSWASFRPLSSMPTDLADTSHHFVDLTGDGLADLASVSHGRLRLYPSLGRAGYGPAISRKRRPDLPWPSGEHATEAVRFADPFGTGGNHLVSVSRDGVTCWPHLGQGEFADPVRIEPTPQLPQQFEASRVFLADLDGSGTVDLIYAHHDRLEIWLNRAGNAFADESLVFALPAPCVHPGQVTFADLGGHGTTAVMFTDDRSQPTHWSLDLAGGHKPHLLCRMDNNRGVSTEITYASSTSFSLEAARLGRPWRTRLPFPVQVVASVETNEHLCGTRLVSSYSYRHGYYDGAEREFRGFAMVERRDAETLSLSSSHADVPPTVTRTWFETGAFVDPAEDTWAADEQYRGDPLAERVPRCRLDPSLDGADGGTRRHVFRALHGSELRREEFAEDRNGVVGEHPYITTTTGYAARLLQAGAPGMDPVVAIVHAETVITHYECEPSDPRREHHVTLDVDRYGNTLRSCTIAYPRRPRPEALPAQLLFIATARVDRFVHVDQIGADGEQRYLTGVSDEQFSFAVSHEMLATKASAGSGCLAFDDVLAAVDDAMERAARDPANLLLDAQRHHYWSTGRDAAVRTLDELGAGSPRGLLALPHHVEVATFTPSLLATTFGPRTGGSAKDETDLVSEAGFVAGTLDVAGVDVGLWWASGARYEYGGAEVFHQLCSSTDPPAGSSAVESVLPTVRFDYDDSALFATTVVDAFGNASTTEYDYELLAARRRVDVNGNVTEIARDALGRMVATSEYGELAGAATGDRPLAELTRLAPADVAEVLADPQRHLQSATTFAFHDVPAWGVAGAPACTVELRRTVHVADRGGTAPVEIHLEYVDGLGRTLQHKTLADPAPDGTAPRWLTSGRTTYNNKGAAVEEFEPSFRDHPDVDLGHTVADGVTTVTHFDPLGRVERVDTPDGFFTAVARHPWYEDHHDQIDTIEDSPAFAAAAVDNVDSAEWAALEAARRHARTHTTVHLDGAGNVIRVVERLDAEGSLDRDGTAAVTDHELDVLGREVAVIDANRVRTIERTFAMTGAVLWWRSADAGERWMLPDASGRPAHRWDSRGLHTMEQFDRRHRPVLVIVAGVDGAGLALEHVVERMTYGDTETDGAARNRRGQLVEHLDQAGRATFTTFDLGGRPTAVTRRLRTRYDTEADWPETGAEALLDSEEFTTAWRYDARGRLIWERHADGSSATRALRSEGTLRAVTLTGPDGTTAQVIDSVLHNARGQRELLRYGNGAESNYTYDEHTFRLRSLTSSRPAVVSDQAMDGRSTKLQDISYTTDPVGNLTRIVDATHHRVFGREGPVDARCDFEYDALSRLVSATGREHPAMYTPGRGTTSGRFRHLNDAGQLHEYTEEYRYDPAGNLTRMRHRTADRARCWTRQFDVAQTSNRATTAAGLQVGLRPVVTFDEHGNRTGLEHLGGLLRWDHADRLAAAVLVRRDGEVSDDTEFYVYDGAGQRVRKTVERLVGDGVVQVTDTIYLGNAEVRRAIRRTAGEAGRVTSERMSVHVTAGEERVAIARRWTRGSHAGERAIRYQLGNHLGSSSLELDDACRIVNYEEYTPYGGTSLTAGTDVREAADKVYRYSGKERDTSTGLYYYGARYYSPSLGRWMSPDPAGTVDGPNLYAFVSGNPMRLVDKWGLNGEAAESHDEAPPTATTFVSRRRQDIQRAQAFASMTYDVAVRGAAQLITPSRPEEPSGRTGQAFAGIGRRGARYLQNHLLLTQGARRRAQHAEATGVGQERGTWARRAARVRHVPGGGLLGAGAHGLAAWQQRVAVRDARMHEETSQRALDRLSNPGIGPFKTSRATPRRGGMVAAHHEPMVAAEIASARQREDISDAVATAVPFGRSLRQGLRTTASAVRWVSNTTSRASLVDSLAMAIEADHQEHGRTMALVPRPPASQPPSRRPSRSPTSTNH